MPVSIGDVVNDRYLIETLIGEGGVSVVFGARSIMTEQRFALKCLKLDALSDSRIVERFAREARAALTIKSAYVVSVHDVGTLPSGAPFLVMEYLEGMDLESWGKKRGALAVRQAAEFALHICEALAAAHARGVVHRDIQPKNLFVAEREGVLEMKVLDIGISKAALTGSAFHANLPLVRTVNLSGAPLYLSPEQLRSTAEVDGRSDIWAMGMVLYEALTGKRPFAAATITESCAAILQGQPQSLAEARPDIPGGFVKVIERCLQKDPAQRFQNVAELAAALTRYAPTRARAAAERATAVLRESGTLDESALSLATVFSSSPPPIESGGPAPSSGPASSSRLPRSSSRTPTLIAAAPGPHAALTATIVSGSPVVAVAPVASGPPGASMPAFAPVTPGIAMPVVPLPSADAAAPKESSGKLPAARAANESSGKLPAARAANESSGKLPAAKPKVPVPRVPARTPAASPPIATAPAPTPTTAVARAPVAAPKRESVAPAEIVSTLTGPLVASAITSSPSDAFEPPPPVRKSTAPTSAAPTREASAPPAAAAHASSRPPLSTAPSDVAVPTAAPSFEVARSEAGDPSAARAQDLGLRIFKVPVVVAAPLALAAVVLLGLAARGNRDRDHAVIEPALASATPPSTVGAAEPRPSASVAEPKGGSAAIPADPGPAEPAPTDATPPSRATPPTGAPATTARALVAPNPAPFRAAPAAAPARSTNRAQPAATPETATPAATTPAATTPTPPPGPSPTAPQQPISTPTPDPPVPTGRAFRRSM